MGMLSGMAPAQFADKVLFINFIDQEVQGLPPRLLNPEAHHNGMPSSVATLGK